MYTLFKKAQWYIYQKVSNQRQYFLLTIALLLMSILGFYSVKLFFWVIHKYHYNIHDVFFDFEHLNHSPMLLSELSFCLVFLISFWAIVVVVWVSLWDYFFRKEKMQLINKQVNLLTAKSVALKEKQMLCNNKSFIKDTLKVKML